MWRRLAEMLHLRTPDPSSDERSIRKRQLSGLEREVIVTDRQIKAMTAEARLGSYRRVRL